MIIAPGTGDEIWEAAGDGSRFGLQLTYIVQDEPAGLMRSVSTAEPFLGDSPFVMYSGDNLLQGGIGDLVRAFHADQPDALILLTPVADPEHYRGRGTRVRQGGAPGGEPGGATDEFGVGGRVHVPQLGACGGARLTRLRGVSWRSPTRSST